VHLHFDVGTHRARLRCPRENLRRVSAVVRRVRHTGRSHFGGRCAHHLARWRICATTAMLLTALAFTEGASKQEEEQ
jgi:hypothetical protein